jgi:radical SAM protein with 4Fe4S-binding SPASM domain
LIACNEGSEWKVYYRLCNQYKLRGWKGLPFAITNTDTGKTIFFNKDDYRFILELDGCNDIVDDTLNDKQSQLLDSLLKQNIIEQCNQCNGLDNTQMYNKYNARYINTVQWSITGRCNYRCRHCFMSAPEAKYGELPLEACLKIIDEMSFCGIPSVSLTGGEPLVRNDLFEIVDALLEKNITIASIYSNGKLVNEGFLDKLDDRHIKPVIHMSYDGIGQHDWLRGIDGAEKYVLDAYKLCHSRGFITTAEMCIHKNNQDAIRTTVELLSELGVSSLKVNPAILMGEWVKEASKFALTTEEAFQVYLDYIPYYFKDNMPINIMLEGFFACAKGSLEYNIPSVKCTDDCDRSNNTICDHARSSLYISPEGIALPCMPLAASNVKEQFPNILDNGLESILTDSFYTKMIDVRLKDYLNHNEKCQRCKYKNACGGGCRGTAIGQNGTDYLAQDNQACIFFKGGYVDMIRITADNAIAKHHLI